MSSQQEVLIRVQATPNPSAWKFVLDRPVLNEGKATYSTTEEAYGNTMAIDLLNIEGVKQVHFFGNVITVSARLDAEEDELKKQVCSVIQTRMPIHNPNFGVQESKMAKRENLDPDIKKIEEILDRTIRPGLQGDGGDIEVIKFEDNKIYVHYQGACGTCPSSTSGTLMAIEGILRDEFSPQIEVIPV
jgi:Fe-S cluster biogenesis protein NfuA